MGIEYRTALFLAVIFMFPLRALADGDGEPSSRSRVEEQASSSAETSPQLLDKRLPAVMPGQEVTANGKKMKVWSSSGPVPVSEPPEPWRRDSGQIHVNESGVGVIVDQRDKEKSSR